jgi:hypothetical protein
LRLAETGYHGASIDWITTLAPVLALSFYQYFASKEGRVPSARQGRWRAR